MHVARERMNAVEVREDAAERLNASRRLAAVTLRKRGTAKKEDLKLKCE